MRLVTAMSTHVELLARLLSTNKPWASAVAMSRSWPLARPVMSMYWSGSVYGYRSPQPTDRPIDTVSESRCPQVSGEYTEDCGAPGNVRR